MEKVKAATLVLDFDLYPRPDVDSTTVAELTQALKAGAELPPVVVCAKTLRVVDGFHRVRAHLRALGKTASISVVKRRYKSDAELFSDAARLNAAHGRKLNSYDRARCALIGDRLGIPNDAMAACLSMTPDSLRDLVGKRTARRGNERFVIKRTIKHMQGKRLTKQQAEANKGLSGMAQAFYANQIISLIEANLIDTANEALMERLAHLGGLLAKMDFGA